MDWTKSIWKVNPEINRKRHPAPFPEILIKRIVKLFTFIGESILDPFMGSGTTGVACKELGRNFIGIEINKEYCDIASKRIDNTQECML